MKDKTGIPSDVEGRIELAISLLGQTRSEMIPAMRKRGVLHISDDINLTVPHFPMSTVSFQLDRWISLEAWFVKEEKQEMKSCCTSHLIFEEQQYAEPYIQWLNEQCEVIEESTWEMSDRSLAIKKRLFSYQAGISFQCESPKFQKKIQPLHEESFHL